MKDKILKIIMNEAPIATSEHYTEIFEINPKSYLGFGKKDLELGNDRGFVNSANTIKKGVECQIDTLLMIFDFYDKAGINKLNYTAKVELLEKINITTPKIIKSVLKLKNFNEQEYKLPAKDKVEDALKTFEAFLHDTQRYIKRAYDFKFDVSLYPEFNNNSADDLTFELKYKNNEFYIFHLDKEILKISKTDENYWNFMKKYIQYWKNI
jgi:hypothetical protein